MLFLTVWLPLSLEIVQVHMLLLLVKDFTVQTLLVKLKETVETGELGESVKYTQKAQTGH